jgi:hypothetical protein
VGRPDFTQLPNLTPGHHHHHIISCEPNTDQLRRPGLMSKATSVRGSFSSVDTGGDKTEENSSAPEMGLERRAYARVGLLGNPSDVYGGRALSFTVADFSATVCLRPSPQLLIQPHPHHDLVAFPSLPQLVSTALLRLPP